jgi:hypothetical protein
VEEIAADDGDDGNDRDREGGGEARQTVALHLGKVASVCLLLGCKVEEESRRMQDVVVVTLSHKLGFSSREDGGDDNDDDDRRIIANQSREVRTMTSFAADRWRPSSNCGTPPLPRRGVLEGKGGAGVDEAACAPHDAV